MFFMYVCMYVCRLDIHHGARTRDPEIKYLMLWRLSHQASVDFNYHEIVTGVYRDPLTTKEAKCSDFVINRWENNFHTEPFFKLLISHILCISSTINLKIL